MSVDVVSLPRAAALATALVFLASSTASAQTTASTPPFGASEQIAVPGTPEFARLIQGKHIVIRLSNGQDIEDVFIVSPTGLTARGDKAAVLVPFDRIVRVQKSTFRIRMHSLIGLGVGAGVGLWMACSIDDCRDEPYWIPIAGAAAGIGAGIGSGVGGILNAINRNNDLIYDASRRTTTMTFAPILSPTRKGVAVTMTWR